ncbi:MAG: flippase [Candidatus Thermoplasmatota archaeon]|nr:flippase [Candidatus Thermoplasmatota archaeon]
MKEGTSKGDRSDRSIVHNLFSLGLADLVNKAIPFITFPYVVRVIGAAGFGVVNFGLAFAAFFLILIDFGLNVYSVREIAILKRTSKDRMRSFINEIFTLKMLLMMISLAIYAPMVLLLPFPGEKKAVLMIFALLLVFNALDLQWVFLGLQRLRGYALGTISSNLVKVAAIFLFVHSASDLLVYAMIIALSNFLVIIIELLYLGWLREKIRIRSRRENLMRHVRMALPLCVSVASITIYSKSDTFMLSLLEGDLIVGIYNGGYQIVLGAVSVLTIINSVFFPLISSYLNVDRRVAMRYQVRSMRTILFVGFTLFVFGFIFSKEIISIVLGGEYSRSMYSFRILLLTVPLIGFGYLFGGQILMSHGKFKLYSLMILFGAFANIILNLCLIPFFSEVGAAAATAITEMTVAALFYYHARRYFGSKVGGLSVVYILMFLLLLILKHLLVSFLPVYILLPLLMFVYFGILFLLKVFEVDTVRFILKNLVNKDG